MKTKMKLDQTQIQSALICGQALVFDEIDSTNEYLLKHHQMLETGSICLAEHQTAGRGRRGRRWYSPESENLYFSILWRYPMAEAAKLPPLSLVVALIIAESLTAENVEGIQIKWPNDIYYQGKKMGGILIETQVNRHDLNLVIGIGLNLGMRNVDETIVTQAWTDLSEYHLDRNKLVCRLAHELQKNLKIYPLVSFSHYAKRWRSFDIFCNKPVKLITESADIHGISQGINEQGELILKQGNHLQYFGIGEISLRAE